MDINREVEQGDSEDAVDRVTFCLDKLEQADDFANSISWGAEVVPGLMIEELVGALVGAEQEMEKLKGIIAEHD